jgi:hypothetical protein
MLLPQIAIGRKLNFPEHFDVGDEYQQDGRIDDDQ